MIQQLKQINFSTSSQFNNERVAVALTAFNRPQLFSIVVDSINRCDELEEVPIFLFLDGGNNSKQQEIIEIFKKLKFKNKYLIKRGTNYGCEKNTIYCLDDLLSKLNFDYAFLIEDDILLGKNYFKVCYDKFKKIKHEIDANIGLFQGFNMCFLNKEEKILNMDKSEATESDHHWGFLISRECYCNIKEILRPYYDIIDSCPVGHNANQAFMSNKIAINNAFDIIVENHLNKITNFTKNRYYKKQNVHCTLGWDGAFELATSCSRFKRYKSHINFCLNIGNYGTHFNDTIFKYLKLDQMTLDEVW